MLEKECGNKCLQCKDNELIGHCASQVLVILVQGDKAVRIIFTELEVVMGQLQLLFNAKPLNRECKTIMDPK